MHAAVAAAPRRLLRRQRRYEKKKITEKNCTKKTIRILLNFSPMYAPHLHGGCPTPPSCCNKISIINTQNIKNLLYYVVTTTTLLPLLLLLATFSSHHVRALPTLHGSKLSVYALPHRKRLYKNESEDKTKCFFIVHEVRFTSLKARF